MGKLNTVMCSYLNSKRTFADLFNGIIFQGKEVIRAEDLQEASEQYSSTEYSPTERFRDIKMLLKTGELLRILAIENQNKVDYTLPYRCMQYDTLEYGKQLEELKQKNKKNRQLKTPSEWLSGITSSDRLIPVYTICLYHGEEPWDGPHSLRDMMSFGSDEDGMSRFFADYPMRLFCVNEQKNFDFFHTQLKEFFTALTYRKDKKRLLAVMQENTAFHKLSRETIQALSVLLNAPNIWKERNKYMTINEEDGEEYDMCQALKELYEDGRNEGLSQGLSQGRSQGLSLNLINTLFQKLLADNRLEDFKKSTTDSDFQNRLLEEYGLL